MLSSRLRRWLARVALLLTWAALAFALYVPRGDARTWPLPGHHPHLLFAVGVILGFIALGLALIVCLAFVVYWLLVEAGWLRE